jgi:uncharacterized protein (DUF697 family)
MNESNLAARLQEANGIVTNHVTASLVVALVPIPIIDLVGLTGIQLKMLYSLSKLYNVQYSANLGKELIAALLGGAIPTRTGIAIASSAKSIPGWGTASSIFSVFVLGGASTYAIGKVFIQHFESGGTFLNFDPEAVREHFAAEFERGKQTVTELKGSQPDKQPTATSGTVGLTTQSVPTAPATDSLLAAESKPSEPVITESSVQVETTPIEQVVTEPSPSSVADSKPNAPVVNESSVVAESEPVVIVPPPVATEPQFSEPVAMVQEPSLDTAIKAREQVDGPLRRTEPTPSTPMVQAPLSENTTKTTEEQLTESPVATETVAREPPATTAEATGTESKLTESPLPKLKEESNSKKNVRKRKGYWPMK